MDLRGRKIYPADWQSFILNPLEVLGVAAGLAFPSISAEHRKWFANTIICGMTQSQFRTPLSQLAPHTALAMVNDLEGRNRAAALDVESMGISDLVLAAASQLAFGELVAGDEVRIEQALMSRALRAAIRSAMRRSRGTRVLAGRVAERMELVADGTNPEDRIVGTERANLEKNPSVRAALIVVARETCSLTARSEGCIQS